MMLGQGHIAFPSLGLVGFLCLTLTASLLPRGVQPQRVVSNEATSSSSSSSSGTAEEESEDGAGSGPGGRSSSSSSLPKKDTLEGAVFEEMLRVVDQKFDSLSARISVLERSINSLNFYSVRQFREITETLEASSAVSEGLRSQVSNMDADDRALKAAVSQVGRDINVIKTDVSILKNDVADTKTDVTVARKDMSSLKMSSSRMFDDIANSIVYFNQNAEAKAEEVKKALKQTSFALKEAVSSRGGSKNDDDTAILVKYIEDLDASRTRNCNVNFRPLEERIDLRFAEMKRQTHTHFVNLINAGGEEEEEEGRGDSSSAPAERSSRDADNNVDTAPSAADNSDPADQRSAYRSRVRSDGYGPEGRIGGGGGGGGGGGRGGPGSQRDGEKVMRMLANMTQNVMEAVSYFRHTGSMMERLMTSTESMAEEQTRLRYDLLEASGHLVHDDDDDNDDGYDEARRALLDEELASNDPEQREHLRRTSPHLSNVPTFPGEEEEDAAALHSDSEEQEDTNAVEPAAEFRSGVNNKSSTGRKQLPFGGRLSSKVKAGARHHLSKFGSAAAHAIGSRGGSPPLPSGGGGGPASGYGGGGGGGGGGRGASLMREVAEESLKVLGELAKNGTQLLDVLTDLAQLSSTSLTKAVGSLHEEVVRLEDVRARLNEGLLLPAKAAAGSSQGDPSSSGASSGLGQLASSGELRNLQNTTKTIFNIVEAIASNTGWIPYIFHNMQHVERLTNRTLELAKRSLLTMHWTRPDGKATAANANQVPLSPQAQERQGGGDEAALTQAQAMDVIYDTNVKLQRIMPALTKLLAEPDALVALTDGKQSHEGRVEVFYKGQWGSVCRRSMGHKQASVVCRHLGYTGGVWAGEGVFERRRGGRQWLLNVTCLASQLCPYVTGLNETDDCAAGHLAVVCDHMLQMTPLPGLNDVSTGLVTMHHQGRWLPICGHGWSGYEARVACKQLGFRDGRELENVGSGGGDWRQTLLGNNNNNNNNNNNASTTPSAWVMGVACSGDEVRLDACKVKDFQASECPNTTRPAAVRCQ